MDSRDRRELNNNFGDGLSRAFELTLTPMVAAGIGLLIDRWLGITPILTVLFAIWGIGVTMYTTWIRYDSDMRRHEDERMSGHDGSVASTVPRRGRARSIATSRPDLGALDG